MITRTFSRWAPLRASLWAACAFIVLRVIYRVVFLGASGGGLVLYSGRPIHLPGPFHIVSLFGPVTTGGLWSSVVGAMPFAALIVGFGFVFSVIDVRRLIAESARLPFGRGMLTSIAIGVATYPALVTSARNIRQIQRLRRESGRFSVVPPLFERTLERAHTLGASMATRGFAHTHHRSELECAAPAQATSLSLGFRAPHSSHPPITVEAFSLTLGEVVLLTGPTGSGKSTLLRALSGLHTQVDAGTLAGSLSIGGVDRMQTPIADTAHFVSFVPQRVRDSFVASTVSEELGFGLQMQGMRRAEREVRIREVVELLALERLLDHRVETLSAGEAVLVALGAALVTRPTLLLLDEPFADLDAHQSRHVATTLAALANRSRMCIVIAEHRVEFVATFATRTLTLGVPQPVLTSTREHAPAPAPAPTPAPAPARNLTDALPITAFVGPNGSGKTTRLYELAADYGKDCVLIPESLTDFFCRTTVAAETARSDKTARALTGTTMNLFLRLCLLEPEQRGLVGERHPRDLSHGQQLALAISIGLASAPKFLLIDEPTRGLDQQHRQELVAVLRETSRFSRIVIASHDDEFVTAVRADQVDFARPDATTTGVSA